MQGYCNWSDRTEYLCRLLRHIDECAAPGRAPVPQKLPRSAKKRPTDLRAAIVAEYQAGATVGELSAKYAVHPISVSNYLDEAGIVRRPRGMTAEEARLAVRLYERGDSLAMIGTRLGFSPHTVERTLRSGGVPIRDRHGRY